MTRMRSTKTTADQAARKALEAKQQNDAAKKATVARAPAKPAAQVVKRELSERAGQRPSASAVRQAFGKDELSKGMGSALRRKAGALLGGPATTFQPLNVKGGPQPTSTAVGPQSQEVAKAKADVEAAYRTGGAEAAARTLQELTVNASPEVAAQIVTAARSTVDKITADLTAKARDVDGDQFSNDEDSRAFDRTVADLSAALNAGASTPAGKAELERVTSVITSDIKTNGIGRWDEALGNSALGGDAKDYTKGGVGDTGLAVSVMDSLTASGKTGEANDILQNVNGAVAAMTASTAALSDKVEAHNQDLARLIQDWSPLMTPEQLEQAIESFKDSHPAYAQLEAIAGDATRAADQLSRLPASLSGLGHFDDVQGSLDDLSKNMGQLAALTDSGKAELAKLQEAAAQPGAKPGLIDRLVGLAERGSLPLDVMKQVSTALTNNAIATALAASEAGDTAALNRAIGTLENYGPIFGLDQNSMESLTASIADVGAATTQTEATDALQRLNRSLDNLEGEGVFTGTNGIGTAVRGAALILSIGTTVGSFKDAINDPNFESIVNAYSSAAGTGEAGVQFAQSFFKNSATLGRVGTVFEVAGKIGGVLTTGIAVFQAGRALANGDPASAALYAAQAAAGILALAGATGAGFVIGVGAALALAQLNKVRASNEFEDEHTEAFLQGAGLSPEATHHLRNADSDGRSVGPVFAEMARRMGVEPSEFLEAVGKLPPDQLLELVEAAHGVDPNGDGEFRQTADTDAQAGTTVTGGRMTREVRPESIQGLIEFLENQGIELDL